MILYQYPYTDFHEINLDYILKLCRETLGLHLEVVDNKLQLKNELGEIISNVTISYATEAGHADSADEATTAQNAQHANTADSATTAQSATTATTAATATEATHATAADSATEATHATNADQAIRATLATSATEATHATNADYATQAGSATTAQTATSATTAATATEATHATNADNATLATRATNAVNDENGNRIISNYISRVVADNTGILTFYAKDGSVLATITPVAQSATEDSEGNVISTAVYDVIQNAQSDYLIIEHGDGTSETITINYAEKAWKDTANNIIKNVYFKRVAIVYDSQTSEPWLVFYNGENSEVARVQVVAQSANYATEAGHALTADHATTADSATNATHATTADSATNSDYAYQSGYASDAAHAAEADSATTATTATTATNANHATTADSATNDEDGDSFTVDYIYDLIASTDPNTWIITLTFNNKRGAPLISCPINKTYQALRATGDESGNNIKDNYAASLDVDSNSNLILKSKNNVVLSTLASPLHLKVDEAVESLRATTDSDQNVIATTYIASLAYANGVLTAYDSRGNILQTINIP